MKQKFVSLLIAVCTLLLSLGIPVYATNDTVNDKGTYLALGDSISTGFELDDPQEQGFAALVAKAGNFELINEAVNNSTSEDLLHQLESGMLDHEIESASLITITCGGNDMMGVLYKEIATRHNEKHQTEYTGNDVFRALAGKHAELGISDFLSTAIGVVPKLPDLPVFDEQLENYRQTVFGEDGIIAYLRRHNKTAVISIFTQYNPYQSVGGIFKFLNTAVEQGVKKLNNVIWDGARSSECIVSDVYSSFSREKNVNLCNCDLSLGEMNLDFHPNAQGHRLIAQTVKESYLRTRARCLGYQKGMETVRLLGSVYNLEYDSFVMEVSYTDQNGQIRNETYSIEKVHQCIYGTVNGKLQSVLEGNTNTYFFAVSLLSIPMQESTVSCKLYATQKGIDVLFNETEFTYSG